jgi:hypothetical protein
MPKDMLVNKLCRLCCYLQLALLPVMAVHQGTYACYLPAWWIAALLEERVLAPLLLAKDGCRDADDGLCALRTAAEGVFALSAEQPLPIIAAQLADWCGLPWPSGQQETDCAEPHYTDDPILGLLMSGGAVNADQLRKWLWAPPNDDHGD